MDLFKTYTARLTTTSRDRSSAYKNPSSLPISKRSSSITGDESIPPPTRNATLQKTLDGGESWMPSPFAETEGGIFAVHFIDFSTGYAVTGRGKIYKTTDSGQSWSMLHHNANEFYTAISFADESIGFVVGGGGDQNHNSNALYKTSDGNVWAAKGPSLATTITSIIFPTPSSGFFAGYDNTVYRSTDAGETWTKIAPSIGVMWRDLFFIDASVGYAVGEEGKIIQTNDGGNSWTAMNSIVSTSLYGIYISSNGKKGFAIGEGENILKYRKQ